MPPPIPIPAGDDPFESVPEGEPMTMTRMIWKMRQMRKKTRVFDHNPVGLKIKVFYDDPGDWFVGNVIER